MSWLRPIVSVLALVALVAAMCVPATSAPATLASGGEWVAMATGAVAEPCPATHGTGRCELKALPAAAARPFPAILATAAPPPAVIGARRGLWPEVEPDPPRA